MNDGLNLSVIDRMVPGESEPLATAPSNREVRDTIPDGREATISGALAVEPVDQSSTDHQTAKKHPLVAKKFRLGVLLVHGMGSQPPRDTLVHWGDVLLKTIGRATKNQVKAMVERGRPGDGSGDQPAEVEIRIRADGKDEHWLLAECWWAGSFPAPSYRELVSWSVRAVPWSIAIHIAQRYWQEESQKTGSAKLIAWVIALVQLLVALAFAPVFIFLLALALLFGLLPIPQLRTMILSAQSTLTGTVGDCLAFVESPMRAAFIMTRILEGLERLKETCDHTLIVAHSQGAAVALNALGGIVESEDKPNSGAEQEPPPDSESGQEPPVGPIPDTLLTFGSGVNQLASLKRLSAGLPKKLDSNPVNTPGRVDGGRDTNDKKPGFNPVNTAVVTMMVTVVLFGWLYMEVHSQRTNVMSILKAAGVYIGLMCILGLIFWAFLKTITRMRSKLAGRRQERQKEKQLEEQEKRREEKREDWLSWAAVAVVFITMIPTFIYAYTLDLPIGSMSILFFALVMLAVSLILILDSEMKEVVTKDVRKPPRLARWIDLYASADPVPNGETRVVKDPNDDGKLKSVQIWNLGSLFSDHTTYWGNLDGFVLRVARACAQTAKSEWEDRLPRETPDVDKRAEWRIRVLRLMRWINGLAWLSVFVLLWKRHEQRVPMPFDLPTWLPAAVPTAVRFALLAAGVAIVAWAAYRILRWPWTLWVRAEQEKALADVPPADKPWGPLIGIGLIFVMVMLLVYAIARGDSSVVSKLLADPGGVINEVGVWMFYGELAFLAVALLLRPKSPTV